MEEGHYTERVIHLLGKLNAEKDAIIAEMREQLRWRDADTEPPKGEGRYLCRAEMVPSGRVFHEVARYRGPGVWYMGGLMDYRVTRWLPITKEG